MVTKLNEINCYFNSKEVNKDGENFNFNINVLRRWVRLVRIAIEKISKNSD
jgi:hypothetical protein